MITNEPTVASPSSQIWQWRGYPIRYQTAGTQGPIVLLIHGLGASSDHWRKNIPVLAENHRVYAIDLIGFGQSAKPKPSESLNYRFETWGQQIADFCREVIQAPVFLVGNSIGCLVALQATVINPQQMIAVALLDCALRLQHEHKLKGIRRLIFPWVQKLLLSPAIGHFFFAKLAQPKVIRKALLKAYARHEAVTDELVEILLKPAQDPGAADVFLSFITHSKGVLPEDLLPEITCPVLMLWGTEDSFEPIAQGRELAKFPAVKEFIPLEGVGHCPQDEAPELVNPILQKWLAQHEQPEASTI
ncbi:alpha/beta fold hydrolase [Leptolyngbya sp. FACHB-17]|uniref:alpha/beta fold hydrolase n=1 Tax=unclassified Leptolyngbya TaxID=2650499 RepID=UPI0016809EA0|nr:alpha/beta fold hydrolase [Leptolyngbya sp. FACHB-17]MBD2081619.1 alpha/beta fold hydrolase [Leptolyngbya sp. FACHB-17]